MRKYEIAPSYGICCSIVLVMLGVFVAGCHRRDRDQQAEASPGAAIEAEVDASASPAAGEAAGTETPGTAASDLSGPRGGKEADEAERTFVSQVRPQVEAFCGDCHAMPRPPSSTREDWVAEIEQGFMLYRTSGRTDLAVPDQEDVVKFFQYQASEQLRFPDTIFGYPPCPIPFRPQPAGLPSRRAPGVTNVRWIDLGLKDAPALVYCNIGTGAVVAHWPQIDGGGITERLATLLQPVHSEACDLDQDGLTDLVVADIGEFNANDSDLGRVVWLRRKPGTEKFESIVLQEGLSRVADVQPGDFDGDGDLDLLVAVFGWRNSGRILMLQNGGPGEDGLPAFELREVDPRHGPSHVPPVDLNDDGHLDFVALISQDHEVVEAFINDGEGNFEKQLIYRAPDPAYGSSGIRLVDMDGDDDLDVLYTNGDSFDRGPKPHHSVQWLENTGSFPYVHHHISEMPGVLNAEPGDFDGDGDMDVVAVSLLSDSAGEALRSEGTSSVVMLVQGDSGEFSRTAVEQQFHYHISVEPGDFDGDGKLDFTVGNFLRDGPPDQPDLVIWWNER